MLNFADQLAKAVAARGTPVIVGLDPRWEQLPDCLRGNRSMDLSAKAGAYNEFCRGVIDVIAPMVGAVKVQSAFFEELGPPGMAAQAEVILYAQQQGLLVILDAKRNDIGSTAEAYARGMLGRDQSAWGADAMTVSPYLGDDSLQPFVDVASSRGAGVFVLVKTSNPGSALFQDLQIASQTVFQYVADYVEHLARQTLGDCGFGAVGAVVGATYPQQLAQLREAMPHAWLLVPGYGSQGGQAADVAAAFDHRGLGAVVNNSRGIIFAHSKREFAQTYGEARWQDAIAAATQAMIQELHSSTPAGRLAGRE